MDEVVDADQIFVMDHGQVVMQGKPRDIFKQVEKLRKYHLAVPQVTELAYELRQEGLPVPEVVLTVDELVKVLKNII